MACAAPMPVAGPAPPGARKTVTIVFCDVVDSTPLADRLDPESLRDVMTRFFRVMREVLERHGGRVEKYIGDAVMAVFGIPRLREDDAIRAVRAAAEMRRALETLNAELERLGARIETRIGVNTGEVVVGDVAAGDALVVGDAVNVAARLEQSAGAGEVLLGEATHALVRDLVTVEPLGPLAVKGKPEPIPAYRLVDLRTDAGVRPEPPLVDREDALATMRAAFARSVDERRALMLTVLGSAGVGKSRLVREFARGLEEGPLVLSARCLPYGEGITFWPVAEIVKQACGIADGDGRAAARAKVERALVGAEDGALIAERVEALIGVGGDGAGLQETFWAVRRFLERQAAERPVVVVLDDLQWAEPTFLDLVEYLGGWSRGAPLLILGVARPDLLDERPTWGGLGDAGLLTLEPLGGEDSRRLIDVLLEGGRIDERATRRISESAEGNPLFLEETIRMLEDDGSLRREPGGWVATRDLSDVTVPASIHALVASRLERLSPEELTVIRCASVIGKVFWWGAVAELAPAALAPRVGGHLQSLVRKDLIRPERSTLAGEDAFRFHHILIQEAAYRSTPKEQRAELHARFADWIERTTGERAQELEEVVGYHLERSVRYGEELGRSPDELRPHRERAGRLLAAAGSRALDRRDMPAAAELLGRAATLLPAASPERARVLLALGEARVEIGELVTAEDALAEAERLAREAGDDRVVANAAILRLFLLESTDPKRLTEDAEEAAQRWIGRLEALGDDAGLARAWWLMGELRMGKLRYGAADEALARAVEHARRAGDRRAEAEALTLRIGCGVYGPVPAAEVERRCAEFTAVARGVGGHEASTLRALALVRAMAGRFDEARELARRARSIYEELGLRLRAAWVFETSGQIEVLAGDAAAAERELRAGLDAAEALGELGWWSTMAAMLAHVLVGEGRLEDAARFAARSRDSAADDDTATQVLWRSAEARILAEEGRLGRARALVAEAIAIVEGTDEPNLHADTLVDRAEVLIRDGDVAAAGASLERAIALYGSKGNEVAAAACRARLLQVVGGAAG